MEKFLDVREKYKRKNLILFNQNSLSIEALNDSFNKTNHKVLILWAFKNVDRIYQELKNNHFDDERINEAILLCKRWKEGLVKMKEAKASILKVHAIAKEVDSLELIALLHAIAQGLSTVHVKTHAIGLVLYELTSIVRKYGIDDFFLQVDSRITNYISDLKEVKMELDKDNNWASFLK